MPPGQEESIVMRLENAARAYGAAADRLDRMLDQEGPKQQAEALIQYRIALLGLQVAARAIHAAAVPPASTRPKEL